MEEPTRALYHDEHSEWIDTGRYYEEYEGENVKEWSWNSSYCDGYMKPLFTGRLVYIDDDPIPKMFMFREWKSEVYELFDLMCPPHDENDAGFGGGKYYPHMSEVQPVWKPRYAEEAALTAYLRNQIPKLFNLPPTKQIEASCKLLRMKFPKTRLLNGVRQKLQSVIVQAICQ